MVDFGGKYLYSNLYLHNFLILEIDLGALHKRSFKNKDDIAASTMCGCFFCLKIYETSQIKDWADADLTALCPHCDIDAVLWDSVTPLSKELLVQMNEQYF